MPDLMYGVLSAIVITISEEMSRLMNCVTNFSENGAMQARLDLMALTFTLSNYFTPNSKYYNLYTFIKINNFLFLFYYYRDFFCDATDAIPPFKTKDNEQ